MFDAAVVCPECGDAYVRLTSVEKRDPLYVRNSETLLTFQCESGHVFEWLLGLHKGTTYFGHRVVGDIHLPLVDNPLELHVWLVDTGVCHPVCLFGTEESEAACTCKCGGRFHGEARTRKESVKAAEVDQTSEIG